MSKFLTSIDDHLEKLPAGSARAKFLAGQIDKTEERYRDFVIRQGDGFPPDVTATDFIIRLSDLQIRFDQVMADELGLVS